MPASAGRGMHGALDLFKEAIGDTTMTPDARRIAVANLKQLSQYKVAIGEIAADTSIPAAERMSRSQALQPPMLQLPNKEPEKSPTGTPSATLPPDVQKMSRSDQMRMAPEGSIIRIGGQRVQKANGQWIPVRPDAAAAGM